MANLIHQTRVATTTPDRAFKTVALPLLVAVAVTAVILTLVSMIGSRPTASQDAGALTAGSYREYSLAMQEVPMTAMPVVTPGAITADSYRQFAEAMTVVPVVTPSAITADSYRQFAEAMTVVPVVTPGAITADSYRQFAEAMR